MNKIDAIELMRKGEKITHVNFSNDEWMTMEDNKILTEDGYYHNFNEYWSYRTNQSWEDGYSIFKLKDNPFEDYENDVKEVYTLHNPYVLDDSMNMINKPLKRGTYVDVRTEPKIQRNSPCTCNSGKKYKNCCLNKK